MLPPKKISQVECTLTKTRNFPEVLVWLIGMNCSMAVVVFGMMMPQIVSAAKSSNDEGYSPPQALIEAVVLQLPIGFRGFRKEWTGSLANLPPSLCFSAITNLGLHSITNFCFTPISKSSRINNDMFSHAAVLKTDLDSAIIVLENQSRAKVIQRPRIQTEINVAAQLFGPVDLPKYYFSGGFYDSVFGTNVALSITQSEIPGRNNSSSNVTHQIDINISCDILLAIGPLLSLLLPKP